MRRRSVVVVVIALAACLGSCGDDGAASGDSGADARADGRVPGPDVGPGAADLGPPADAGPAPDDATPAGDLGPAPTDTGPAPDVGPSMDECGGMMTGACATPGLECQCCPAGGPTQACLCSTPCASDAECTDPARPVCNTPRAGGSGFCAPRDFRCCWECNCASPDTPVATPFGERPMRELAAGDLVFSVEPDGVVVVPLERVQRVAVVPGHRMVALELASGRTVVVSPRHPMADGRDAADVRVGDVLDGVRVVGRELVPYAHSHTFDVLPASSSGTYFAAGVLVGSTMRSVER